MSPSVYITPNLAFTTNKITNPYIADLGNALDELGVHVIRSPYVVNLRTLDFFLYLFNTNVLFLNWPEDLYHRPLGKLQVSILKQLIRVFVWRGGKVVWTMHNRVSHREDARHQQSEFTDWIIEKCHLVIVHAEEGLDLLGKVSKKIYYPHPFNISERKDISNNSYIYDAIIWGNLSSYKGVDVFLEFLNSKGLQNQFKILICGKCSDQSYKHKLKKYESSQIIIHTDFVTDEQLALYFKQSRTVLFTHFGDSVLTSGTLAKSLSHFKTTIAPNRGNFKDFAKKGVLYTYDSYSEVADLLFKCQNEPDLYMISESKINTVICEYSWLNYAKFLIDRLL
ncbi:glycosyltransferase [Spirosoma lituiforme]